MTDSYAGFIDVGFLHAEGARKIRKKRSSVRLQAAEVVRWLQSLTRTPFVDGSFLRAYWYDAAFGPEHPRYRDQRKFLDAIAHTPGVQLRLGHLAEHPSRLEKPVRQALAQDFGVRALVATPDEDSVSKELAQLADEVIVMNQDEIEKMMAYRLSA